MEIAGKYFSVTEIMIITKKMCTWTPALSGTGVTSQSKFLLGLICRLGPKGEGKGYNVRTAMKLTNKAITLEITLLKSLPISDLLSWVSKVLNLNEVCLADILGNAQNVGSP